MKEFTKLPHYIGKNFLEISRLLRANEFDFIVESVDGVPQVCTADYRPDRLRFKIDNGIIKEVTKG